LPRRWRIVCFLIVTPWQLGIILSANYTFLNYLVLILGFLLLDDRFLLPVLPQRWKVSFIASAPTGAEDGPTDSEASEPGKLPVSAEPEESEQNRLPSWRLALRRPFKVLKLFWIATILSWIFYATTAELIWMFSALPLPTAPVEALEPFRIANRYGLFGIMTRGRYEIEFQGSDDGKTWVAYQFRYKPQDVSAPPGIYAPYQPRFDWNLWFASLGSWRDYPIVPQTEVRLLSNDNDVLALFAKNPFPHEPPRQLRAVIWQYWFTTLSEKRAQGMWWRRQFLGLYAPTIERAPDGNIRVVEWPTVGPHE
ncbi:MAG TPA: lipase maturation factor family protein, partial [Verrucomicrobiae bacterium]|nr:lipase maturation factor family protein [Verrucomicrobiae bacterium]